MRTSSILYLLHDSTSTRIDTRGSPPVRQSIKPIPESQHLRGQSCHPSPSPHITSSNLQVRPSSNSRRVVKHHHSLNIQALRLGLQFFVRLTLLVIKFKVLLVLEDALGYKSKALASCVLFCRTGFQRKNVGRAVLRLVLVEIRGWRRESQAVSRKDEGVQCNSKGLEK